MSVYSRRGFFGVLAGLVSGVCAAFLPGKAEANELCPDCGAELDYCGTCGDDLHVCAYEPEKRSGTKFICNTLCDCNEQKLTMLEGRIIVICPHNPPYFIEETNEGGLLKIEFFDRHSIEKRSGAILTKHSSAGWTETDIAPMKIIHKGIAYERTGHS